MKLEVEPEMVYVANVCTDHVPAVRRPPVLLATSWALAGRVP